jgi:NAD-dependent deacetylase
MPEQQEDRGTIEQAAEILRGAGGIVILTGAGISTESGIPDFRGPQGVWTKNPDAEKRATIQHYMANRDARVAAWKNRTEGNMWQAEPNAGHRALADLDAKTKIELIVTQNVDGLHQKGGFPVERLVEIHGTVTEFRCMNCTDRGPIDRVLARVRAGEEDPPCRSCGGILKTATISFGQGLVPDDLERSQLASSVADTFLAIGTTLGVWPAAGLPEITLRRGGRLIILNAQETPYDDYAEVILRGQIGTVLPQVVAAI